MIPSVGLGIDSRNTDIYQSSIMNGGQSGPMYVTFDVNKDPMQNMMAQHTPPDDEAFLSKFENVLKMNPSESFLNVSVDTLISKLREDQQILKEMQQRKLQEEGVCFVETGDWPDFDNLDALQAQREKDVLAREMKMAKEDGITKINYSHLRPGANTSTNVTAVTDDSFSASQIPQRNIAPQEHFDIDSDDSDFGEQTDRNKAKPVTQSPKPTFNVNAKVKNRKLAPVENIFLNNMPMSHKPVTMTPIARSLLEPTLDMDDDGYDSDFGPMPTRQFNDLEAIPESEDEMSEVPYAGGASGFTGVGYDVEGGYSDDDILDDDGDDEFGMMNTQIDTVDHKKRMTVHGILNKSEISESPPPPPPRPGAKLPPVVPTVTTSSSVKPSISSLQAVTTSSLLVDEGYVTDNLVLPKPFDIITTSNNTLTDDMFLPVALPPSTPHTTSLLSLKINESGILRSGRKVATNKRFDGTSTQTEAVSTVSIHFANGPPIMVSVWNNMTVREVLALALELYDDSGINPRLAMETALYELRHYDTFDNEADMDLPPLSSNACFAELGIKQAAVTPISISDDEDCGVEDFGPTNMGSPNTKRDQPASPNDVDYDSDFGEFGGGEAQPGSYAGSNYEIEDADNYLAPIQHHKIPIPTKTPSNHQELELLIQALYSHIDPEYASTYTEWRVIKTNSKGKRQDRWMGVDRHNIHNRTQPRTKERSFLSLGVARETRPVLSISHCAVSKDNMLEFSISFKNDDRVDTRHYDVNTVRECAEIIARLRYLINNP